METLKRLQAETAGKEMLKSGKLKAEMESAILPPSACFGGTSDRAFKGEL